MLHSLRRWLSQRTPFKVGDQVLYRSRGGQEQVCRFVQADDDSDVMLVECSHNSFWVKRHQVQPLERSPLVMDASLKH
jgi:hypothetical protein